MKRKGNRTVWASGSLFKAGNIMKRKRNRTVWVSGSLFKVGSKYVCWNSFAACWYLGPKRLSEIFDWSLAHNLFKRESKRIEFVRCLFPSAKVVDLTHQNP